MFVNFYYDLSDDKQLTSDPEGCLVQLCQLCALKHKEIAQFASRGDDQSECELCRASNDADYSAEIDQLIAGMARNTPPCTFDNPCLPHAPCCLHIEEAAAYLREAA